MNKFYEKASLHFAELSGYNPDGATRAYFLAQAKVMEELEDTFEFFKPQMFAKTANADYLYFHFGGLYPPKEAVRATGKVFFFGDLGTVIPKDTELSRNEIKYRTTEEGVIKKYEFNSPAIVFGDDVTLPPNPNFPSCTCFVNGEKVTAISSVTGIRFKSNKVVNNDNVTVSVNKSDGVPVLADEDGKQGNLLFNDQMKTTEVIEGLNVIVSVLYISQGRDIEGVEDWRKRIRDEKIYKKFEFIPTKIVAYLLEKVPQLWRVWVEDQSVAGATPSVTIYAINRSYVLTVEDKTAAQKAIKDILPIGLLMQYVKIESPKIINSLVRIQDLRPSDVTFQNAVKGNIENLFYEGTELGSGISSDEIRAYISRTEQTQLRVPLFKLLAGEKAGEAGSVVKLTGVNFETS